MIYPVLTYSRDIGDFSYDLAALHRNGLKAIRLIYKGKSEADFCLRISEIQEKIHAGDLDIDIMIDLPGSKPIVGDLGKGLAITSGQQYHLSAHPSVASAPVIPTTNFFSHECFPQLAAGDIISIADDEVNLVITGIKEDIISCEALNSFFLTSNRSLSVKNRAFPFQANSEKDIQFVQNLEAAYRNVSILVSFTRKANDLRNLKLLQPAVNFIPKIEDILDDATLLDIMDHCNTLMLGRGDLSTSSLPKDIFTFQHRLIDLCAARHKQLIIGTGLLAGIGDKDAPSVSEVMDYGYLRSRGVHGFLIAGTNAHKKPMETLRFMQEFEL